MLATISVPLSKQTLWPRSALRCHVLGKVQWSETSEYKLEVVLHDQPSGPASTRSGRQAGRQRVGGVTGAAREISGDIPLVAELRTGGGGVGSGLELCNTSRWFGVAVLRCVLFPTHRPLP